MESPDILRVIPDEEIKQVRDLFRLDWPDHIHIYNFLDTCLRWKNNPKYRNSLTVYCPDGDWTDGTIITILEIHCYILVYSLDKNLARLKDGLRQTKLIDWNRPLIFPIVRTEFTETVVALKKELSHPFRCRIPGNIWWLPKEKALQYEWSLPEGYYVSDLKESDGPILNSIWPHRHPGSEQYISTLIALNGGIGLFSSKSHEICGWVMKNYFGGVGLLQIVEDHKRKGFGTLLAKIFSKKLAEDGLDVIGCIINENTISQNLFSSLGFQKVIGTTWLADMES